MRLRFLGTGTSFGIPQVGCRCAVCCSTDPRDRRTRSAAVVETAGSTILIDTPPELRLQLVAAGIARVDAVLYTHEHADHINGIDDLRIFTSRVGRPLPIHGPPETLERLRSSFNYIFDATVQPYHGTSKPQLDPRPLAAGEIATVAGVPVLPLAFDHGHLRVFGYRIGNAAYITDVKSVPPEAQAALAGLDVLVINALWWREHPTHLSIPEAIAVASAIGARRTFLTHLTHETGHAELAAALPRGIEPACDGLVVEIAS
jgi:phosphoribosyl 1,2-cyclic phosphate phosphodiesterase